MRAPVDRSAAPLCRTRATAADSCWPAAPHTPAPLPASAGMAAPAPSPGRAALRDMSNEATPSPCARKAQGAVDLSDQATPPQAAWTTGDQFKFVEEDDDEVLFRVRDSGVLRSLALPELTRPEVVTPPNAVNADETLEQKQVLVCARRALRCCVRRRRAVCACSRRAGGGAADGRARPWAAAGQGA